MFAWFNSFIRHFLAPIVVALLDRRVRQLAEYALTAVKNMEFSELKGLARREVVLEALKKEAQAMGLEIQDHVMAALLENALARVRDKNA
jgi:hypothetical protein